MRVQSSERAQQQQVPDRLSGSIPVPEPANRGIDAAEHAGHGTAPECE
jgi:hypothetical protein